MAVSAGIVKSPVTLRCAGTRHGLNGPEMLPWLLECDFQYTGLWWS